jgi:hypothetical protein
MTQDTWQTIKFSNEVHIQALNPKCNKITFSKDALIKHIGSMIALFLVFKILNWMFCLGLGYFWLGLLMKITSFKTIKGIFTLTPKYSILKARSLIKGEAYDIGREFLKNYQLFDFMLNQSVDFLHD